MGNRVGVLLVHGIGKQSRGTTLSQFGDPLIKWLRAWGRGHHGGAVDQPSADADPVPEHVRLRWETEGRDPVEVVMAECWWAETFTPASAREVLSWIPVVGYRLLWRFARTLFPLLAVLAGFAYLFFGPIAMGFASVGPWSWYVVVAAAGLVLTAPIVLLVLAWFLMLPFTGGVGGRVNETIGAIIGDAWVLTHSPTRFSRMRRRFATELGWLQERTEKTVVIAHSQGSVVAVEALNEWTGLRCDMLITVGSAIRLLHTPEHGAVTAFRQARPACRWIDISSGFDVVSSGAVSDTGVYPVDVTARNPGSIINAHTSYFDNPEGCLAVIQAAIGFVAHDAPYFSPVESRQIRRALALREQRGWLRGCARWLSGAAIVSLAAQLHETTWAEQLVRVAALPIIPTFVTEVMRVAGGSFHGRIGLCLLTALAAVLVYDAVAVSPLHNWWHRRAAAALAAGRLVRRIDRAGILFVVFAAPLAVIGIWGVLLPNPSPLSWLLAVVAGVSAALLVGLPFEFPYYAKESTVPAEAQSDEVRAAFAPLMPAFEQALGNYQDGLNDESVARIRARRDDAVGFVRAQLTGTTETLNTSATAADLTCASGAVVEVAVATPTHEASSGGAGARVEPSFELTVGTLTEGAKRLQAVVLVVQQGGDEARARPEQLSDWRFYILSRAEVLKLRSGVLSLTLPLSAVEAAGHQPVPRLQLGERLQELLRPVEATAAN